MRLAEPWWLFALAVIPYSISQIRKPSHYFSDVSLFDFPQAKSLRVRLRWIPDLLRCTWLALLILALCRPQTPVRSTAETADGLNTIALVDVSGSMGAIEFSEDGKATTRLDLVRTFLSTLFSQADTPERKADSFGLITVARYVDESVPLTRDRAVMRERVAALNVELLENRTNLGDGIALATQVLHRMGGGVLLICTDGASNVAEGMQIGEATRIAESLGIRIYTVGVGSIRTTTDKEGFKRDEKALQQISATTGGKFWRADATGAAETAAQELAKLEPTTLRTLQFARWRDHFPLFLAAGAFFLFLDHLLRRTWLRISPAWR